MINPKHLLKIFFGKTPVENVAMETNSLKKGIITYSIPFFLTMFLLVIEILIFHLFSGIINAVDFTNLAIELILIIVGAIIMVPLLFLFEILALYIFGGLQFVLTSFYKRERGSMSDFMGSFLKVMASIRLIAGLLFLFPIAGWIGAMVAGLYGIMLDYRFIREKFNLNDSQSAVVVLIPTNLFLALVLIIVTAISFFLIGSRVL